MSVVMTHRLARCLAIISNLNGKTSSILDNVEAQLCCQAGWAETAANGTYVVTMEGHKAQNEYWSSRQPLIVARGPLNT
jgi:hypothetical protein